MQLVVIRILGFHGTLVVASDSLPGFEISVRFSERGSYLELILYYYDFGRVMFWVRKF